MTKQFLLLTASLGLTVIATAFGPARAESMGGMEMPSTMPATQPMAVNKLCPVTKEPVDPAVKTVTYDGKVIGFCCPDCVKTFNADPAKYMQDLK